jgi:homoserine kinase type II
MAVYTDVGDDQLSDFFSRYDLGEVLSSKGIAEGVENTNYLVHCEAGTFILTLYEQRVNRDELPFFIGLMEHLAAAGLPAPVPVRARDGEVLHTLCGRPAALVSFLDGMWRRKPDAAHCAELGRALGRLHEVAASYAGRRDNTLGADAWRPLFAQSAEMADTVQPGLRATVEHELDALEAAWPADLPAGVIHADLFPDNVFFVGKRLSGIIDFYFACNDLLAYDIAICLNAWCFEPDLSFNVTKARALLSGYAAVRPLSGAEYEALPVLARGAALRFLLTRLHDWLRVPAGALVTPKNPIEYLRRLQFHRRAHSAADYGLTR